MDYLVGNTGFVGSNLVSQYVFDGLFNSKNINDAFDKHPDLLVYSGVKAEMFLANKFPDSDKKMIDTAIKNIENISPKEIVLISTVAVYPSTKFSDENSKIDISSLSAYGRHRYELENWVENNIENHLIVRLPALFGMNLKKNFIYDFIHVIPSLLSYEKFNELIVYENQLKDFYIDQNNGFFKCRKLSAEEEMLLKDVFKKIGFTSLNFTDSRSIYQFYDLNNLWNDIEIARKNKIKKINLVTPPIKISELYYELCNDSFCNELNKPFFDYDLRTVHSDLFGCDNGYIMIKERELNEIKNFVRRNR